MPTPVGLVVCRGCCCGSAAKHPEIDHAARLDRMRTLAGAAPVPVTVRVSECLGPCEYADIVVVTASAAGRRAGGRPAWFGFVDDYGLEMVCAWAASGGPGVAPVPDQLLLQQISRPRRAEPAGESAATAR